MSELKIINRHTPVTLKMSGEEFVSIYSTAREAYDLWKRALQDPRVAEISDAGALRFQEAYATARDALRVLERAVGTQLDLPKEEEIQALLEVLQELRKCALQESK